MDKTGKILLVDDEESIRLLYCEALRLKGYDVECVASAEEALEMFKRSRWSLVISDVCMPGMGGRALYDAIRSDYPYLKDRFLFITGKPMRREELQRLKIKCLAKPFTLSELMAAADKLMKRAMTKTVREDTEKRKVLRRRRRLRCTLYGAADNASLAARTRDYSSHGVGIAHEGAQLELDSRVRVAVNTPGLSFDRQATVMWSIPAKDGGWMSGLRFLEPHSSVRTAKKD